MKLIQHNFFIVLTLTTLLLSCKNEEKQTIKDNPPIVQKEMKYAKGFKIEEYNDYKKLIISAPYKNSKESFEFILSNNPSKSKLNTIKTPVTNVVVTSTTHIPMLELLGVEDKLVGFPNTVYVSSERTRKLIDSGKIIDLGNEENINTELLLDLNPDVLIGFSINSNNKMFGTIEKIGIPVILNGAWLEETPLGRAEWIKLFGVLFNKEKEADSIFTVIETNYLEAKKIVSKSTNKPTIISGGLFKDIWNLPAGDSFEATFLKDAYTDYLWKDSEGKGSLSLNIENVYEKGKDADIWVSPSFYTSLDQLEKANEIYSNFKAFKTQLIYSFSTKKGATGGLIYFELAPARPDLVLKDLIKIAHPELMKGYQFTFFEKLK